MKYILLIGLFSLSHVFVFSQDKMYNSTMMVSYNNENKANRNRDNRNRGRSRDNKDSRKEKNSGFNFWFFSSKSKNSHSSSHNNYMKIFDSHAIFDFDEEIALAVSNSEVARETFQRESRLLAAQIKYYEEELMILLDEQLKGTDRSDDILETYNTLYELSYENFSMMNSHTQEITEIFKNTFDTYDIKIREKIKTATTNKEGLLDELTTRYNIFLNN